MQTTITVETALDPSPRVLQARGLFDLAEEKTSRLQWNVSLPLEERPWLIGLITGPSGCGKSTIARRLWPDSVGWRHDWNERASILDGFPASLGIKEITALLSSVGFSSPPAWLRPFHVLSTGQQFRVTLARLLAEVQASPGREPGEAAEPSQPIVFDEYTSVVDRTVAKIGSTALARTLREQQIPFIAVTCHDDVIDWLQPDWVYEPAEGRFTWRYLQRRPAIRMEIVRCQASAWPLFAPNHYLNSALLPSAVCFLASWKEQPVAFSAWLPFVGAGPAARREHRTVTLPDYQSFGTWGYAFVSASPHLISTVTSASFRCPEPTVLTRPPATSS